MINTHTEISSATYADEVRAMSVTLTVPTAPACIPSPTAAEPAGE